MAATIILNETDLIGRLKEDLLVTRSNLNDFFLTICAVLVFAMQAGFSLMETGLVRSKNATNVLMKSTLDAFVGATAYWLLGYAFMFGDGNDFIGWTGFALYRVPASKWSFWFYQSIFANTASTIASGAAAERINLTAFLVYSFLLTGVMYPVAARWAWHPDGWLKMRGFFDYGGSGVVHMLGGVCALVATLTVGSRIGRFGPSQSNSKAAEAIKAITNGHQASFRGHSTTLAGVGAFFSMLGILAYNTSSQLSLSEPGDGSAIAKAATNTLLAGSSGAIISMVMGRATPTGSYRWSYFMMVNGAIAGMVSSCAGCNAMPFWAAYVTGAGAGLTFFALRALIHHLKVDDPLDAFSVHFGGGFSGMVSAPLLVDSGVFLVGDYQSAQVMGYQLAGICVLIAWGAGFCLLMFGSLKWCGILRVDARTEVFGMDAVVHDEPAYPAESWEEQQYWDHQAHRLIHLLTAAAVMDPSTTADPSAVKMSQTAVVELERFGLPPQMNFAHLVLTDHFQKCVLFLDHHPASSASRKWRHHI